MDGMMAERAAAMKYDEWAKEEYGSFACLNFKEKKPS